ncbi:MAG TPA: UTP--glucose-1-phosphate uridylyltransferase [Ilumatobacteraceae bacterium]|nr:UTP--glucose-1-phosphate uridylyltransferase [Ilumatobacteraceae bacterium]
MPVTTAIIPAAGMGTRFLPFTKAVPKELLPLGAVPAMQRILDECVGAGIEHVVIVTSHDKPALRDYFAECADLVESLRDADKHDAADAVLQIGSGLRISFAFQDEPLGLGHAVGCARQVIDVEDVAVLLPDEIMGDASQLRQMIEVCERTGGGVVALRQVPRDTVHRYGVVVPDGPIDAGGVVRVVDMVEKPTVESAPSDLIIIGRYVLTGDIFERLANTAPGSAGEIQLTDALRGQAASGPFHGLLSDVSRHDTGNPLGWFKAVVWAMASDPELGEDVRAYLAAGDYS